MVAEPPAIPVARPVVGLMVTTAVFELDQAPPAGVAESNDEAVAQKVVVPPIAEGAALTVNAVVTTPQGTV